MNQILLSEGQLNEFYEEGFIVLKNFYDLDREIKPIQFGIWKILGILFKKYNVSVEQKAFSGDTFDFGYQELISVNRAYGGEVYDAVKQIPGFMRLFCLEKNEHLFSQIRGTDLSGIAAAGYGIRIDNPNEEKFRSVWHYEYRDQLRSIDGIVFWSPLVPILPESGPVQICPKSHKGGLRRSFSDDPEKSDRTGAYGMRLENEKDLLKQYEILEPLSEPGDLILMDFLTLHSSGKNISNRSRWSMQFRYFNFNHPSGIKIDWVGGVASGVQIKKIHPELIIE
jgi:hypothetical protein